MDAEIPEGYKETPVGIIPKEWNYTRTISLFDVKTGTTPSTKNSGYWENGSVAWLTPNDLSSNNGQIYIKEGERTIAERAVCDLNLNVLPEKSIIISTRAPVGYVSINTKNATINQGCKGLVPKKPNSVHSEFYYYILKMKKTVLESFSGGSTFKELSKRSLENIELPYPPLLEQRKIATILTSVDSAIQETDAIIDQTEQVKRGLMQELFTKGIGHTAFQDTRVGRAPEGWKLRKIGDIAEVTKLAGFEFTEYFEYTDAGEVIALRAINIKNEKIDLTDIQRITKQVSDQLPRSKVNAGDVLITYIGAYIGDVLLIKESNLYHLAPNVAKITPHLGVKPEFLEIVLRSDFVKRQYKKLTALTATPSLTMTQIRKIDILIPNEIEQRKIASIILNINKKLDIERHHRHNLEKLKTGLMQDLLTGKKRVKVDGHE